VLVVAVRIHSSAWCTGDLHGLAHLVTSTRIEGLDDLVKQTES
jgi:hypothetical protein